MILCSPDEISYEVAPDGKSITFHPCGTTSHHPQDIIHRYCARCHRFMGLLETARKLKREML